MNKIAIRADGKYVYQEKVHGLVRVSRRAWEQDRPQIYELLSNQAKSATRKLIYEAHPDMIIEDLRVTGIQELRDTPPEEMTLQMEWSCTVTLRPLFDEPSVRLI